MQVPKGPVLTQQTPVCRSPACVLLCGLDTLRHVITASKVSREMSYGPWPPSCRLITFLVSVCTLLSSSYQKELQLLDYVGWARALTSRYYRYLRQALHCAESLWASTNGAVLKSAVLSLHPHERVFVIATAPGRAPRAA